MKPYQILIVEDDAVVRRAIRACLTEEGYLVSEADGVKSAWPALQEKAFDLIILDILFPDGSGLELCRNLRGITQAPILFLTCLGEKSQVVRGLRSGADDYIVKPFDGEELIARVETLLRRTARLYADDRGISAGPLVLEAGERRARWMGRELILSPKEFQMLAVLCRNRNRFTSAEELYSEIWGMSVHEDVRTVKVHISGLRRKLRHAAGKDAPEIVCQRDRGYRLEIRNDIF